MLNQLIFLPKMQNLIRRQIFSGLRGNNYGSHKFTIPLKRNMSVYDPDYLDAYEPDVPEYDTVNIQFKGYDYVVLENYQKLVHRIAKCLELDVTESWATPGQYFRIQKLKPQSTALDCEYQLCSYERNVQVSDMPSTKYPILLRFLQASLPQGVTLNVHEHLEEHDEIRYVPDKDLIELKTELENIARK